MEFPMGLSLADKFKLLRKAENLSQAALCEIVGISQSTVASLERGRTKSMNVDVLAKVVRHPRFAKYAIWLLVEELTDEQAQDALDFVRELKAGEQQRETD